MLAPIGKVSVRSKMKKRKSASAEVSTEALEKLSKDPSWKVRLSVAANKNTALETLLLLIEDKNERVSGMARVSFSERKISSEMFLRLAKSHNKNVRYAVARHPDTPAAILADLSNDEFLVVLFSVIENKNTTIETLVHLITNEDERVSESARVSFSERNIPYEMFLKLAKNRNKDVRYAVAEHPHAPAAILKKLSNDEDDNVRAAVAYSMNTPVKVLKELAEDSDSIIRHLVAENPHTPANVLDKLAKDSDEFVRDAVISNPAAPAEVLTRFAKSKNAETRELVADNPSTPAEVLARLAKDANSDVRATVLNNPSTPEEIAKELANTLGSDAKVAVLSSLSKLAGIVKELPSKLILKLFHETKL